MKKKKAIIMATVIILFILAACPADAVAPGDEVIPGGQTVGIRMEADGMVVSGFTENAGDMLSGAKSAGLEIGDRIVALGGESIVTGEDFRAAMEKNGGEEVELLVVRGGEEKSFSVKPQQGENGWQLGLWLRSGISGLGTVTFCDPETGLYGALGHGVSLPEDGSLMVIAGGEIYRAAVTDISRGTPGELQGEVAADEPLGSIERNTVRGIFGYAGDVLGSGERIVVASDEEITLGEATILATVDGTEAREYSVEITRVSRDGSDTRQLALDVTDEALLRVAGGIVQGMSGSPILQNGKLIGAVTHVLLSDPTKGYGISMENMLRAAAEIAA